MRLRELELVRYGGYADRILDFGDASTDLHLIVGANEAGKSTTLAAIGDWLFGFPGQTTQDWRFDYKDLRIRAVVEQAGRVLEAIRRKGAKNTLLGPAGESLAEDTLSALMGGVDRPAFERLFGLDHAKLRLGGQAILEGKDDAARAMFEAGTGLASVTAELKRLEARCGALFKPSASNPEINRLLRERGEALKKVRDTSLGDAELTRIEDARAEAIRQRADLTQESESLTARANAVERVSRTRAPLGKLAAARAAVAALGPLPVLPPDAEARLREARTERATAAELRSARIDQAEAATTALSRLELPEAILAARVRIEAVAERRLVVDKALEDRPRRVAELERIDAALDAARADAGLPAEATLPSDGWRRRARAHLESWRALERRVATLAADRAAHATETARVAAGLADLPATDGLEALLAALAALPADLPARLARLETQATRAADRVKTGLSALGWSGTAPDLAGARLPAPQEAAEHGRRIELSRDALKAARDAAEAAAIEAARQQRTIEALTEGAALPTPAAVAAARGARDAVLADVRHRLAGPRQGDDAASGRALSQAVLDADALADRRDGESQRLAQHALAVGALAVARDDGEAATRSAERWRAALAEANSIWSTTIAGAGLPLTLLPAGFESWRALRDRTLEDAATASETEATVRAARDEQAAARRRLSLALVAAGAVAPDSAGPDDLLIAAATARAAALVASARAHDALLAERTALARQAEALTREADGVGREQTDLARDRERLQTETGAAWPDPGRLSDALTALEAVVADAGRRSGVARQIEGIDQDSGVFAADVAALLADLGRTANPRAGEAARGLAQDLAAARQTEADIRRLTQEAEAAAIEVKATERRLAGAEAVLAALTAAAGVDDEAALDAVLAACARAADGRRAESEASAELADLGDGRDIAALEADAAALPADEAAAARESIARRREEIDAERDAIARSLAETQALFAHAATATEAADAQQAAADAGAALAAGAERFVETAAAAALLKWLVDRHRAGAQAPLLARAGALFAQVTGGAYVRLALDYDDDDRPRIVAVRADGSHLGVEGMSEGTRDQLFLALRLGSLQGHGAGARLPLVCDDLLITSDDARAGAILGLLETASASMQVLVFTHHEHLVDVATRAIGAEGFRVHRLESRS